MTATSPRNLTAEPHDARGSRDGRMIGRRYQVLRTLKSGIDTETLLATDLTNRTTVVIKTAEAASFSATARMRLEHETHVLTQIKNGPFTLLLDYGTTDDQVYLVMPFIEGITLQQRLEQGRAECHGHDHAGPGPFYFAGSGPCCRVCCTGMSNQRM